MKLAAIDIGSNAIRMQITQVISYQGMKTFKKLQYIRFPLRLGHDVFILGKITASSEAKFIQLMQLFKSFIDLYEVIDYYACATAAMRESENGYEITEKVRKICGLNINIIDGDMEADLINRSIYSFLNEKSYLHIDVGGGSTEFNLYVDKEKIASRSFKVGSVRSLETHETPEMWGQMKQWIKTSVKSSYGKVISIGTGGNINKVAEMASKKPDKFITLSKLKDVQKYVSSFSMEDRMNFLQLNPDRADVIVPAMSIYISAMGWAKCSRMIVPDAGLKDGLIRFLYEKVSSTLTMK